MPLIVADGLGGHRGGDIASRFLVEQLLERVHLFAEDTLEVAKALTEIDAALVAQMLERPDLQGMGSTLAAAFVSTDTLTIINVGDSRVYLTDVQGGFRQVSIDDVPARSFQGFESDTLGLNHAGRPRSHSVTQAFGGSSPKRRQLQPHIFRMPSPKSAWSMLLCSDGLTDLVQEQALRDALSSPLLDAAKLVEMALESGGTDNISVILVRHGAGSKAQNPTG